MVVGRMVFAPKRPAVHALQERFDIAVGSPFSQPVGKLAGKWFRRRVERIAAAKETMQVMGDAARPDQQDTFVAQPAAIRRDAMSRARSGSPGAGHSRR